MANKKLKKILGVCVATSMLSVSDGSHLVAGNILDVYGQAPIEDNSAGDNFDPSKENYAGVYGPAPVGNENHPDVYVPTPDNKDNAEDKFDPSHEYITNAYGPGPVTPYDFVTPLYVGADYNDTENKASYTVTATGTNATVSYTELKDNTVTELVIPDTITINGVTYKVTSISKFAFMDAKNLTSITLGDNITDIPADAFAFCSNLKNITIGKNVTSIGNSAFEYCSSLTKITIPASVTQIGKKAFYKCTKLKTVTIGANLTSISNSAFQDCERLNSITIKSKKLLAKNIGKNAFDGVGSSSKKVTVKVPSKKYVKKYKTFLKKNGLNANVKMAIK